MPAGRPLTTVVEGLRRPAGEMVDESKLGWSDMYRLEFPPTAMSVSATPGVAWTAGLIRAKVPLEATEKAETVPE